MKKRKKIKNKSKNTIMRTDAPRPQPWANQKKKPKMKALTL